MENNNMTEKESLALITDMINKTKQSFHETGFQPIMWGAVITVCGLLSFLEKVFHFKMPFNHWSLVLLAILPQVVYSIWQSKKQIVKSYNDIAMDFTWSAFGISMGVITFIISGILYNIPQTEQFKIASNNFELDKFTTGIYLVIYAIPTFITGGITKFKLMLLGGILCWILAIASAWTGYKIDMLFTAIAATFAWLIPGLILNARYRKHKKDHGNV